MVLVISATCGEMNWTSISFLSYVAYIEKTSLWNNLHPHQVVAKPAIIKDIDCLTVTVKDILNVQASFSSSIEVENTRLSGFGGWFDVQFRVS